MRLERGCDGPGDLLCEFRLASTHRGLLLGVDSQKNNPATL